MKKIKSLVQDVCFLHRLTFLIRQRFTDPVCRADLTNSKNVYSTFARYLLQIDMLEAKCISHGSQMLANSIESLIALYCHRFKSNLATNQDKFNPLHGTLADQIDASINDAAKSDKLASKLWYNLKTLITERLTR